MQGNKELVERYLRRYNDTNVDAVADGRTIGHPSRGCHRRRDDVRILPTHDDPGRGE